MTAPKDDVWTCEEAQAIASCDGCKVDDWDRCSCVDDWALHKKFGPPFKQPFEHQEEFAERAGRRLAYLIAAQKEGGA